MSELSERVAVQHGVAWIGGSGASEVFGCACGHRSTNDDEDDPFSAAHNRHVAEVTEAAVRETIAAELRAASEDIETYGDEERSGLRWAARIARGET